MSVFQDLAVEVAFPVCAIARLNDVDVRRNETVMERLSGGKAYRADYEWWIPPLLKCDVLASNQQSVVRTVKSMKQPTR